MTSEIGKKKIHIVEVKVIAKSRRKMRFPHYKQMITGYVSDQPKNMKASKAGVPECSVS